VQVTGSLGLPRQKNPSSHEFKANLGNTVRPCLRGRREGEERETRRERKKSREVGMDFIV
jgi:hypothetical protein